MEMLENLDPLLRTFWYVAIPASLIFLVQSILTIIGGHAGDSLDAADVDMDSDFDSHTDGDHGTFHVFSFRNLINFLLGFSWAGITLYSTVSKPLLLITISVFVGIVFIYLFFVLIQQLQRFAEDNTFNITDTIGEKAEVYLRIPAKRTGVGKVLVSVKGAVHELEAITDADEIPSNEKAIVVGVEKDNVLIVKPK